MQSPMSKAGHFLSLRQREDYPLHLLLIALVLFLFGLYPLADLGVISGRLTEVGFTLVLIASLFATQQHHVVRLSVVVLALPVLAARWLHAFLKVTSLEILSLGSSMLFVALVAWILLRQVLRSGPVNPHRIEGAVAVYLLMGLWWSVVYSAVLVWDPRAFSSSLPLAADHLSAARMVYFSFVTMTSVGYGDITPVNPLARSLAMLQALFGQLFPVVLLARLVAMELETRRQRTGG